MTSMNDLAESYLAAVVKGRHALNRILTCVADLAERDARLVRTMAQHPELLAALVRSSDKAAAAGRLFALRLRRPRRKAVMTASAPRTPARRRRKGGKAASPRRRNRRRG